MSMDELANVKGRGWEDIDVRGMSVFLFARRQYTDSTHSTDHACKRHGKRSSGLLCCMQVRRDWTRCEVWTCRATRATTTSAERDPVGQRPRLAIARVPDKECCRNGIGCSTKRDLHEWCNCCVVADVSMRMA